jgi:hypothetical protein
LNNSRANPRYDLTAEAFIPQLKNLELFTEIGHVDWRVNQSYPTLGGLAAQSFTFDRDRNYLGIGMLYTTPCCSENIRLLVGGAAGGSRGSGTTGFYGAGITRGEWATDSLLVSLDVRADYFSAVASQAREFNELGNALFFNNTKPVVAPSVELRLSMRVR